MLILHATFWNGKWLCLLYFFSLWACTCAAFVQCSNSQGSVLPWFAGLREASAALFNPRGLSYGGEAGAFCTMQLHFALSYGLEHFGASTFGEEMTQCIAKILNHCCDVKCSTLCSTIFQSFKSSIRGKIGALLEAFPLVGHRIRFILRSWGLGRLDLTCNAIRWRCTRF